MPTQRALAIIACCQFNTSHQLPPARLAQNGSVSIRRNRPGARASFRLVTGPEHDCSEPVKGMIGCFRVLLDIVAAFTMPCICWHGKCNGPGKVMSTSLRAPLWAGRSPMRLPTFTTSEFGQPRSCCSCTRQFPQLTVNCAGCDCDHGLLVPAVHR